MMRCGTIWVCQDCLKMSEWVDIGDLIIEYRAPQRDLVLLRELVGRYPYPAAEDPLVEAAKLFLERGHLGGSLREYYLSRLSMSDQLSADCRAFGLLDERPIDQWAPIRARRVPSVALETPISYQATVFDGAHRIAMALAKGHRAIRCYFLPPIRIEGQHIYGHPEPYQTLIFPDGVIGGVRGNERWSYLRAGDIEGRRIGDIGCSSGVDGILAVVCGAKSYRGFERDKVAIRYGRQMAQAWGVAGKVGFEAGELVPERVPLVDTLFVFSVAQRISPPVLCAGISRAQPHAIYLETHCVGDRASQRLLVQLSHYTWELLGTVPQSRSSDASRELYRGAQ